MKLSEYATDLLAPYVTGDGHPPSRKGPQLVALFNKYGARDKYDFDAGGLPDIGKKDGQSPSRTQYTEKRLKGLSGKPELRALLEEVFNQLQGDQEDWSKLNEILNQEGYSVVSVGEKIKIEGGIVDNRKPVANQAHFENIQSKVLAALDKAKVSIDLAMAWFTNDILRDKLLEKQKQGVNVRILIYNDGVNAAHGVDLTGLTHKYVRGQRGGLMHNKFCVIDNQVVITGSYNWSTNAEFKNDENVSIQLDSEQATTYSVEFRRLQQQQKNNPPK